ncbi:MAG TPA: diaminopimelate epimerase [Acidimicrobiales bacterium]|nr:diaminopimelate epimerase [Acidimicrobiales bacterium]
MMRLEKYHGLGNDFLVLLDLGDRCPVDAAAVRALCDRHRGVGADGVIRVTPGPTMELFNADGSRAEMSGNGIRCLAMAMVDAGLSGPRMVVHTDAGDKEVTVDDDGWASVDMGMAKIDPEDLGLAFVDMGNPHTVVEVEDLSKLHISKRAAEWTGRNVEFVDDLYAVNGAKEGINVEYVVAGPGPEELSMRVFERGVGETQACGSGACAAAVLAHAAGLVGPRVTVHQSGGDAIVELMPDGVVLTGPAEFVCEVEFPWP